MSPLAHLLARPEILALPSLDLVPTDPLRDSVRLNLNENPYPPMDGGPLASGLNRYPEPQPAQLRQALAALYGVRPEQLLVTRGGDDAIDVLVRTFCRPGEDAVSVCVPSFTAYAHFARVQGARVLPIRLNDDFDFEPEALLQAAALEPSLKLAFLCSPNNPTGNPVDPAEVLRTADALPQTILVLDEAYIEFSNLESLASEAAARENLVVLRTLSKAWGLAGARVGCLIGNEALVALVARALPPYPMPSLSVEAALAALTPARRALHAERISRITAERERLAALLAEAPMVRRVRPSQGNFLFLEVEDPAALERRLAKLGVRLRFRPNAAPGGVRLTIGTEAENALALAAFGIERSARPGRSAEVVRDTKETRIGAAIDLDRPLPRRVDTGIPFFDHMLDQVAAHAGLSLILSCEGDVEVDAHHSIEDCAIVFGQALARALGERRGIGRFGFALPMDEAMAQVIIDLSGRPFSHFEGRFTASHIGSYPTEMTAHVFRSLADTLGAALHVRVEGENDHHKTEACFKALGRALRQAIALDGAEVPSTKGVL